MIYDNADDPASSHWSIFVADATGGGGHSTKTDLGANAPRDNTTVFELTIFADPNNTAGGIGVRIVNLTTATLVTDQAFTSNIAATGTFAIWDAYVETGTAATATALDLIAQDEVYY
jgi:hypothetical protein